MSKIYKKCPICDTDKSVTYITGSHAEGRPTIIEGESKYIPGDCIGDESYECYKCGGEFSVQYEIHNGKIQYLKINYKGSRKDKSGYHTWA